DLSSIDFADVDSTGDLTVTLATSTGGQLTLAADGTVTFGGTATSRTVTGTLANLNAYFDVASNIQYLHGTANTEGDNADTITISISDGIATANLGSVNVDISGVNDDDEQITTNTGMTIAEDATGVVITQAMLETTAGDNTPDELTYTLENPPTSGTLRLSGSALDEFSTWTQADINAGNLTYDQDGASSASDGFSFFVSDGVGLFETDQFFITITLANTDDEAISTNTGVIVNEGSTGGVITQAMLETTAGDNTPAELTYTLTTAPTNGTLRLSGAALSVSGTWTQANINANALTYDHDGSETTSDSFGFTVSDGAGNSPSGTFAVTVTPVDDTAPVLASGIAYEGRVVLTFTEGESTPLSGTSGFTIQIDGTTVPVLAGVWDGLQLTLFFDGVNFEDQTVTVAATSSNVQDAAGNSLADFSAVSVGNSSDFVLPTAQQVESGVVFGDASSLTGTLVASSNEVIVGSFSADALAQLSPLKISINSPLDAKGLELVAGVDYKSGAGSPGVPLRVSLADITGISANDSLTFGATLNDGSTIQVEGTAVDISGTLYAEFVLDRADHLSITGGQSGRWGMNHISAEGIATPLKADALLDVLRGHAASEVAS
ncbi:MAG: cadherin-like domain-containing protein, partial [Planctomycetota bacterium]